MQQDPHLRYYDLYGGSSGKPSWLLSPIVGPNWSKYTAIPYAVLYQGLIISEYTVAVIPVQAITLSVLKKSPVLVGL